MSVTRDAELYIVLSENGVCSLGIINKIFSAFVCFPIPAWCKLSLHAILTAVYKDRYTYIQTSRDRTSAPKRSQKWTFVGCLVGRNPQKANMQRFLGGASWCRFFFILFSRSVALTTLLCLCIPLFMLKAWLYASVATVNVWNIHGTILKSWHSLQCKRVL